MNTCKSNNNFYWAYVDISYFDEIVRWAGEELEGTYVYIRPFININHLPIVLSDNTQFSLEKAYVTE